MPDADRHDTMAHVGHDRCHRKQHQVIAAELLSLRNTWKTAVGGSSPWPG
jgi:hypothetical protein